MLTADGRIGGVHLLCPNPGLFSPRGFVAHVAQPHRVVSVPAASIWGRAQLDDLRSAALVRLDDPVLTTDDTEPGTGPGTGSASVHPGSELTVDQLVAQTALALSMAAVPVAGASLRTGARTLLDPELLGLLDQVTAQSAADAQAREGLCLQLRRRAWELAGFPRGSQAVVAVLLPEDAPAQLAADLEHQSLTTWLRLPLGPLAPEDEARAAVADARSRGATYVTRMDPALRYGPHHLADLVHALRHSGAAVAHSPARFWAWEGQAWLEDDTCLEREATQGLPGGALWYAADGPHPPELGPGYAVHGGNAVPGAAQAPAHVTAWRRHADRPDALAWLGSSEHPDDGPSPAGAGLSSATAT